LFISIYFELILPLQSAVYVSDGLDVLCYCLGAITFAMFFNPEKIALNNSALA
jgi:hypothetical protein